MARLKTEGLENYDVEAVLGIGSLDVGTLCTSPVVKKWSKDKPLALMAANDKSTELTENDKKNYQEGVYTKPYGIFPVKADSTVGYGLGWNFQNLTFDDNNVENSKTIWQYSQPKALNGKVVNGENKEIWARLSDFCGYNHDAVAPFHIEWVKEYTEVDYDEEMDETITTTHKGIFAKITRANTQDGMLGLHNFRGEDSAPEYEYASVVVMTDDEYPIDSSGNQQKRYAIGRNNHYVALKEGETKYIGYHSGDLLPLSGQFYFIVVDGTFTYEDGFEGWGGINGRPYYFPRIKYGSPAFIPEGGLLRASLSDVTGGILFMTSRWYILKYTETSVPVRIMGKETFSELDPSINQEVTREWWPNGLIFEDINTTTNIMPDLIIKMLKQVDSNRRRFTMMTGTSDGTIEANSSENYFSNIQFQNGRKAFLHSLTMYNGSASTGYYGDIYVDFQKNSSGNLITKLCIDVMYDNKVVMTKTLYTHTASAGNDKFIGAISFMNEVSLRGLFEGVKLQLYFDDANKKVTEANCLEFKTSDLRCVGGSTGNVDYGYPILSQGDIRVGMSKGSADKNHPKGGKVLVSYGFFNHDTPLSELYAIPSDDPLDE